MVRYLNCKNIFLYCLSNTRGIRDRQVGDVLTCEPLTQGLKINARSSTPSVSIKLNKNVFFVSDESPTKECFICYVREKSKNR